ncbi:nucleoside triphosphate pyrophosphatase [Magnetovibrio sp. PR-2]|uniref:Maf family protein n=1 Tax=Magnetovibrio sp. PR-2 TaxID=3120356 RepID=UPI002FCE4D68
MTGVVVLASTSQARTQMLSAAGLEHIVHGANIDETTLQNSWSDTPARLAETLAEAKALNVSPEHADALVIGCDQVLALGDEILTKPGSPENVRAQLKYLRGKQHSLLSSVSVVQNGDVLWTHTDIAHLSVRDFSDAFLDVYVERVGEAVKSSVGGYHLEGLGAQLFDRIDGDYFTVLGLPLVPLLNFLRTHGAVQT